MSVVNFGQKHIQWITLALLAMTWGSSFILMKRGLLYFDSREVAAFRMTLATLVLLPVAVRNLSLLKEHFWIILLAGLSGNAIPYFLFAHAQTHIDSALSGILNSLTSLFTLIIGVLFYRVVTTWYQLSGIALACIGVGLLIGFEHVFQLGTQARYAALVVLATALYGVSVNVIKHRLTSLTSVQITSLAFFVTGPLCAVYLFAGTDFVNDLSSRPESWKGIGYLSILAIVGTALAVLVFNLLIKETTAVFASSVTYLIPIVAVLWGLADGETMEVIDLLYMLLILGGIFLINSKQPGRWLNRYFR